MSLNFRMLSDALESDTSESDVQNIPDVLMISI